MQCNTQIIRITMWHTDNLGILVKEIALWKSAVVDREWNV